MSDIQEVELSIEHARELIARKEAVERLFSNKDFKTIIETGYFKDEASRLVLLSADVQMRDHEDQIKKEINSISCLNTYLRTIVQMGQMAAEELRDYQEALDEMRAEDEELA